MHPHPPPPNASTAPAAIAPSWRRVGGQEGAAQLVQLVLLAPLLGLLMLLVAHAGLYLTTRQAVVTATAEALKHATVHGATPTVDGAARAVEILDKHSAATAVTTDVTVDDVAGTVTVTVTADAPAVAPGLPRSITHTQTGTHERWLTP